MFGPYVEPASRLIWEGGVAIIANVDMDDGFVAELKSRYGGSHKKLNYLVR